MTPLDAPPANQTQPAIPAKPAVEARQGVISGRIVTVLLISITLSCAALFLAWLIFRP